MVDQKAHVRHREVPRDLRHPGLVREAGQSSDVDPARRHVHDEQDGVGHEGVVKLTSNRQAPPPMRTRRDTDDPTALRGPGIEPVSSHDGSELFYRNGTQMLAVGVVETEPELIVTTPEVLFEGVYETDVFGSPNANYDVSAEGRFLMIWRNETDTIALVQNWHEELKRLVPVN